MRRLALGLVFGLGCAPSSNVAPTPAAPEPAGSGGSAPTPELFSLAPWMHVLVEPGLRRTYAWSSAVETHDREGSVAKADGTLRCRSDAPIHRVFGAGEDAWFSCQTCELAPGRSGFEPAPAECYLVTAAGLWIVGAPPDAAEVRRVVAEPPYLPANPEPHEHEGYGGSGGIDHTTWTRVERRSLQVLDRTVDAWCRSDGDTEAYFKDVTRCFVPGLGLVLLEQSGDPPWSKARYALIELPSSEAPSPPAPRDPALAELPRWLRALFDPVPLRIYTETDSDVEGQLRLQCRAHAPTRLELGKDRTAFVSCQTCDALPEAHGSAECFIGTPEGLWLVPEPLGAADTRRLVDTTPPYLAAELRPRTESRSREPRERVPIVDSLEVGERAMTVMGESVDAWCRTDTSKTERFAESTTRCFTPDLGLVVLERRSSFGPLLQSRRLIEITPLPQR